MAISRKDARQLVRDAADMGARILQGKLTIDSGEVKINGRNVAEWLAQSDEVELTLIVMPVNRQTFDGDVKSCSTCGRDYRGSTCPYCAEVRARLRG